MTSFAIRGLDAAVAFFGREALFFGSRASTFAGASVRVTAVSGSCGSGILYSTDGLSSLATSVAYTLESIRDREVSSSCSRSLVVSAATTAIFKLPHIDCHLVGTRLRFTFTIGAFSIDAPVDTTINEFTVWAGYPTVPAVLIGWLARHNDFAGIGLGEALLFDAIRNIATAPIGAHAVFADAIDERAAAFYEAFGFTPLLERPHSLYLPISVAMGLIAK